MKLIKKMKKGFTLVELVVVIAIIAILAGVSVGVYVGITTSAKKSADSQVVAQLNIKLRADNLLEGKNKTAMEAFEDADEIGFNLAKMTPQFGDHYVWDEENDLFAVMKGEEVVFQDATTALTTKNHKRWIFTADPKAEEERSQFFIGEKLENALTVKSGFDAGFGSISKLTYENGVKKDVIIRTLGNMCELSIMAPNDHVEHYGYAKETKVVSVNTENSYHEYGTSNQLKVTAGKVVIENSGVVFDLSATENATAEVKNNGGNVMAVSENLKDKVTPSETFEINNLVQLEAFRDATNSGETFKDKTINLNCDISLKKAWKPISNYYRKDKWDNDASHNYGDFDLSSVAFQGKFKGNGHTISGLTNKGLGVKDYNTGYNSSTPNGKTEATYGLFALLFDGAEVSNLKLTNVDIDRDSFGELLGDSVGAVAGYSAGSVTLNDIAVSGKVSAYDSVGGIIGCSRYYKTAEGKHQAHVSLTNCSFEGSVTAQRRAAGLIAQVGQINGIDGDGSLRLENCSTKKATIDGGYQTTDADQSKKASDAYYYVGALVAHKNSFGNAELAVTNCVPSTDVHSENGTVIDL